MILVRHCSSRTSRSSRFVMRMTRRCLSASRRCAMQGVEVILETLHDPGEGTRTSIDGAVVRNQIVVEQRQVIRHNAEHLVLAQRSREEPLRLGVAEPP